ncbi:unnamed protein product, partial [Dracunculus medinensis]|uniref:ShKT domain-containing protein n=1 Tax=Dracunculus medinensis TaxID=318479 RepID=A0A0N4U1K8_DRAME
RKLVAYAINQDTAVTTPSRCLDNRTNCFQYAPFCTNPKYREVLSRYCPRTCNLCKQCASDNNCRQKQITFLNSSVFIDCTAVLQYVGYKF